MTVMETSQIRSNRFVPFVLGCVAALIVGGGLSLPQPAAVAALDATYVPRLIAGGGQLGHGADGDLAACPTAPGCAGQSPGRINYPLGMAIHPDSGEFFFSQGAQENNADLNDQFASIRRIRSDGTLQTVVGDGNQTNKCTSNCDGAVSTSTQQLRNPGHMVFDSTGTKLFVLDGFNGIREVTFAGTPALPATIATVAHTQIPGSINSMAQVIHNGGLAIDSTGSLYFGGRVLDQSLSSLLRLSVFKRTTAGVVTEVVSSDSAASGAPTQKQGSSQFSGPRDIKVVGSDLYVLYDNKLIRTDLSGNLEAEYTLSDEARSVAVIGSTVYVGLITGGRVVSFPDNAPNTTAVAPTQTVRFGTAGNETFAIGNTQASIELTGPRSMMVHNGSLYISDMKSMFSAIIGIETPPDVTAPVLQSAVLGSSGTSIALTYDESLKTTSVPAVGDFVVSRGATALTISSVSVSGSVVTLSLGASAVDSSATVTISYTPGTNPIEDLAGNDAVALSSRSVTNSSTVTTTTTTTTTTVPATTTTVPAPVGAAEAAPTLVTSANQSQLVAEPGEAVALINGQKVAVETVKIEPDATPAQQLATAKAIVAEIASVLPAGEKNAVAVVETDEGAEISGLMVNPEDPNEPLNVPVESVTLVDAGSTKVLISALNQTNLAAEINPSGVIEVTRGGLVAAKAYGLPGSETGEIVLMSTPRLLKTFTVDANGSYSGQVPLPKKISFGTHTVVMATKSAKVSLGIKLVRTRMQFRIKRTIGTTIFRNRARIVKKGGGKVTISSSGRCRATATRVKMSSKPGACYITVRQAAKGKNKAVNVRFTVQVVKKAIKPKARAKK